MSSNTHSHPLNAAPPDSIGIVKRKYIDIADEGIQTLLMISSNINKETGVIEISQDDLRDALDSIARSRAVKVLRTGEVCTPHDFTLRNSCTTLANKAFGRQGLGVSVTNPKTAEPLTSVQAGRLSFMQVCSILSVDYQPAHREYIWSVPGDDADNTRFHVTCIGWYPC